MDPLLELAAARAQRYLDTLGERPVGVGPENRAALSALGGPLPEHGCEPARVLELLDRLAAPATVASAGPRYFGFVTGGALPVTLGANWMAGAWDQNAFSVVSSPAGAAIEAVALDWVLALLGLARDAAGAFVTGATMANFTALAAARHAVLADAGFDVERHGLFGAPPISVVVSEQAHAVLYKALGMLGLGRERVVRVPVDAQGRLRAGAMPPLHGPTIVCLQAGNVNSGAFDPAAEVADAVDGSGAWVHVDGAFGLWAAAAPARAHLARGMERADSWAIDAHKWLNVPYDSGLAIVRRRDALAGSMSIRADYLVTGDEREPFDYTPEASRRMRGLEVWAAIKALGRGGVADLVERCCRHAGRFAEGLRAAGFEVLNDVVLNQVLVAFGDDARTRAVVDAVQAEGTCWCGGTTWNGRAAMRISVSSWATTEADVQRSVEAIVRVATGNAPSP